MSLIFSKLVESNPLIAVIALMRDFIVRFGIILDIFKEFAGNRVTGSGILPRRGVVHKFSDLEVIALSAIAESFGDDSENYLFKRLESEKGNRLPKSYHTVPIQSTPQTDKQTRQT